MTMNTMKYKFLVLLLLAGWGSSSVWAASTKFRLLNASNEQVAYCESRNESGRTGMIPSDMVSPLVDAYTYYPTLADAQAGTNGAADASGFSDVVAYVKYTLTAAGKELFTGGTYKIYADFASTYLAYSGNTEGKVVGSWGSQNGGDGIGNNTWILTGDPYSLQMHVASNPTLLASYSSATSSNQMAVSSTGAYNKFMIVSKGGGSGLILRINEPEGEYSSTVFSIIDRSSNNIQFWRKNNMWNENYGSKTFRFDKQSPSVTLTATNASPAKGEQTTLTATATLSSYSGSSITYTAIEQKDNVTGNYTEVVNTANSTSATYAFTPNAYGTFYFRAKAKNDVSTNLPGYSEELAITVPAPNVPEGNYTLKLIDKSGNELVTTTVSNTDIADSGLDPLPTQWRSPMVTQYKYYQGTTDGKTSAQAADNNHLIDFANITDGQTIYVGYTVGDDLDLNSSSFTSLNDDASSLMQDRVGRAGTTDTHVRDASKFGKMYMLKFKTSAPYYAENTNDGVSTEETPSGSFVYPYTNGDGPLYVYPDQTYQSTKDDGASTRTRYPWYLVSLTRDPYHVYITSWQTSHNQKVDGTTNYYSYLRTYYNSTLGQVVTSNVTDDPTTKDGATQILPTEYMLLTGNGTAGAYKLMTTGEVNGSRQTVTSLEQYWRTYPTAQNVDDKSAWHEYSHWVNAKQTASGSKVYENAKHWFQTIQLGDGSLDIVETNIDGVLVLLDNHGWEIMRHPIVQRNDPDYESVKEALKKYDSPMVATYKFYATRNVDHKVAGYHKYNINNDASKALTDAKHLKNAGTVITSLADYPETMDNGALADLYVTYDVKEEYAANYAGAATEAAVTKSAVNVLQGGKYAKANGTSIEAATDASEAGKWYVKPNFNIDAEMGYRYDVDVNGLDEGTRLTKEQTNAAYYAYGHSGFDPYNLQIQNVADPTKYFTTNASSATLDAGKWSGNGTTVNLDAVTSRITPAGYDQTTLAVTNTTFMAVQDANGNMRLMPRFDHEHVVNNLAPLATPAAAQAAGDASHEQSTKLSVGEITYKVIDNSGAEVFSETVTDGAGISLPRRLESPFVEKYTYHSTLALATGADRGITSEVTGSNIPVDHTVYVGYKVKDNFGNGNAWNIFGAGTNGLYVHPVYQDGGNGSGKERGTGGKNGWWKLEHVQRDFKGWTKSINTSNFPFLDNGYAWEFAGDNPDPYNALLFNKGTQMYINHYSNSGTRTSDYMTALTTGADLDRYAFVYFDNNEESDDVTMYNRSGNQFVRLENDNRLVANRLVAKRNEAQRFVVTQLPQITINVVNSDHVVEVSLQGYYKNGASWTNSTAGSVDNTPFYLDRAFAQGHTFYYDQDCKEVISGEVDDTKVMKNGAVYVSYTLASDWGTVNETNPDYGTTFKPADNESLYWYVIRPQGQNDWHFKANTTTTPSTVVGKGVYSFTEENIDQDASRLSQWTFLGTPYNLKIVDRYHGTSSWVGVSKTAEAQATASVYDTFNSDQVTTTWELTRSLTGTTPYLYIRPQHALSGDAPLLYLTYENKICMDDYLKGVEVKYVTKTDARSVTFKLRNRDGSNMGIDTESAEPNPYQIADYTVTGVATGESLTNIFAHSPQQRRYCEYKFYSDEQCTTEITEVGNDAQADVYVKWDYTDDAPVFSIAGTDKRDYQYYMMGVGGGNTDNAYSLMDVEGEGTAGSPYTFRPNNTVGTPRDLKHQFAIVGDPYRFKLYNRAADKDIRRNKALEITFAEKEADGTTDTEEITFDMPIVSGAEYTNTECHFRSTTTGRYLSITGSNDSRAFTMTDWAGTTNKTRFRYIIVPLYVFYEENTTLAAQKDYRMYGLELNPNNAARETTARFDTQAMRASNNKIGLAFDFNHAFCDYTFYRSYNWTTGELSDAIPEGGLSYYGGKIQTKRQFFATYTVDWDQFGKLYLIAQPANDHPGDETKAKPFLGKGNEYPDVDGYRLKNENSYVTTVRADNEGTYRFKFIGDPYDLQIINIGANDDNMVLGAKCITYDGAGANSVEQGLMTLNKSETYSKMSHFEIIQRSNGNHVFYLLDNEKGRFFSSLHPSNNNIDKLIAYTINDEGQTLKVEGQMGRIKEFLIIPAIPQHSVTWNIVDANHNIVATKVVANAEEGTEFTLDDMPETLKRHYCEYNNMYSDQECNTQYTGNKVTLGSEGITIYVPYELNSSAPNFVTEVPGTESADDKYWYETAFPHAEVFVYASDADVKNIISSGGVEKIRDGSSCPGGTTWDSFRWALIGTPYGVQLYNRATKKYLCIDGDDVKLGDAGTTFDLMDDWQNDLCAIYDKESKTYIYRLQSDVAVSATNNSYTSVEFSNADGLTTLYLRLHYSEDTQRLNGVGGTSMKETIENIHIISFQKNGKPLIEVMPEYWKRAFCNYSFYWDDATTENSYSSSSVVTTITDAMVAKSKKSSDNTIYVHVTYKVESPFDWSTETKDNTGKHWYYLVNNHRPAGEQGKMVFRATEPGLRVSESLVESKLYLNNYEWCVIGDPYGFKLLNRYDPDHRFDEYISVTTERDGNDEGCKLEQVSGNGNCIYEMMPGQYSYNFWIHPAYDTDEHLWLEYENGNYSYVGNNYNGSSAIVSDTKRAASNLKTNGSANFRLEIQSARTLSEYVKYAGFVGGLVNNENVTDDLRDDAADDMLSDENKQAVRALIDDPANIVQMEQGYYRIIPFAQEGGRSHKYVRGYLDKRELTGATDFNGNLKVENANSAEYDPASIFWFESTMEAETNYPRYLVTTQGLDLYLNTLVASDDENADYKVRYEDLGAAITQLKVGSSSGAGAHNYLSVSSATTTETSINQCFDEQGGVYKTRFYLQKVGTGEAEMPFKMRLNPGHNGTPLLSDDEDYGTLPQKYSKLPYTYTSLYVPFDLEMVSKSDAEPFIGLLEHAKHASEEDYTYYLEGEKSLFCQSIDIHQNKDDWKGNNRYVPAATPVVFRSVSGVEEVTFVIPTDEPSAAITGNVLGGSYLRIEGDNDPEICLFGKESVDTDTDPYYAYTGRVGFFPRYFSGGKTAVAIPANKATYKTASVSNPGVRAIYFEFDVDATGITTVGSRPVTGGETYDLQGRRVRQVSRPGVYIKNGRKIMVK